jgi:O-succinylbenzoate synthase
VKLKIRPGWDTEVIREVRREFPTAVIHVDANSGYTLKDIRVFQELDELNLAMFEQPLQHDDLLDHADLARQVATPICLDESITSATRARQAIEIGACRLINIKPGRVGGVTNALEVLQVARAHGVPCWIGGMLESAIGVMPCMALAALPGMGYPADIFPTKRFWSRDLADKDITQGAAGEISAFKGDGIGCVPDRGELYKRTVASQII